MSQTHPQRLEKAAPLDRNASGSLLVFLKAPRPGAVKTRLATAVGDVKAAQLYENWTTTILEGLQPLRDARSLIGYYGGEFSDVQQRWQRLIDRWLPQPSGDLGARLDWGFTQTSPFGPTIAIGTDCLDVDAPLVQSAFSILEDVDAVIGPAGDGGYYLLGLKRPTEGLFDGIEWSTSRTFQQQRDALRRARFTTAELPMLNDIDTIEDWLAFQRRRRP